MMMMMAKLISFLILIGVGGSIDGSLDGSGVVSFDGSGVGSLESSIDGSLEGSGIGLCVLGSGGYDGGFGDDPNEAYGVFICFNIYLSFD